MSDTPQTLESSQPTRGFVRRNWWWLILAVLCVLLLIATMVGFLVFQTMFGHIKDSEPYRLALTVVQNDPTVIERLGKPVSDGLVPCGELDVRGEGGSATLYFRVRGPNGEARVNTQARRIGGVWGLTTLDVTFADGQRTAIALESEEGVDEAPLWTP